MNAPPTTITEAQWLADLTIHLVNLWQCGQYNDIDLTHYLDADFCVYNAMYPDGVILRTMHPSVYPEKHPNYDLRPGSASTQIEGQSAVVWVTMETNGDLEAFLWREIVAQFSWIKKGPEGRWTLWKMEETRGMASGV